MNMTMQGMFDHMFPGLQNQLDKLTIMGYKIGDVVWYKVHNYSTKKDSNYYGEITSFNNGFYTIKSFNGMSKIVDPEDVLSRKE